MFRTYSRGFSGFVLGVLVSPRIKIVGFRAVWTRPKISDPKNDNESHTLFFPFPPIGALRIFTLGRLLFLEWCSGHPKKDQASQPPHWALVSEPGFLHVSYLLAKTLPLGSDGEKWGEIIYAFFVFSQLVIVFVGFYGVQIIPTWLIKVPGPIAIFFG